MPVYGARPKIVEEQSRWLPTEPWQMGLWVTGIFVIATGIFALVYRVLSILIGERLTQLLISLAVLVGITAGGFDWVGRQAQDRRMAVLQASAAREGRTL